MLNLHAWNLYMGILCVLLKIDEEWCCCSWILLMNSWLIVVVAVMRCVVDELIPWVLIIIELWCELSCWGEFWWNIVKIVELYWNDVLISSSIWFWWSFKYLNKLWGRIWVLGESKLWFSDEKWWKTGKNRRKLAWSLLMASSVWKQLAYGQKLACSALLIDSLSCFAFLHLFHTFLFWIGFRCKHESFR